MTHITQGHAFTIALVLLRDAWKPEPIRDDLGGPAVYPVSHPPSPVNHRADTYLK